MLTRLLTFLTCAAFGTALPTAPGLHTWRAIGLQGAAPNATEWKLTTAGNRIGGGASPGGAMVGIG